MQVSSGCYLYLPRQMGVKDKLDTAIFMDMNLDLISYQYTHELP